MMRTYSKTMAEISHQLGISNSIPTIRGKSDVVISGLSQSSKSVNPGDLFVALPGYKTHGSRFVAEAAAGGARGVLTDIEGARLAANDDVPMIITEDVRGCLGSLSSWFYDNPSQDMVLIGITGTNGKTTIASILEFLWRQTGVKSGVMGTLGTRFGDSNIYLGGGRTTPEACDVAKSLVEMRDVGVKCVAMEVSSHALDLGRVRGNRFALSLFTNLTQDHLDFHGDMKSYFAAKSALFTAEYTRESLINIDDEYGSLLAANIEIACSTLTEGFGDWVVAAQGPNFSLTSPQGRCHQVETPLVGNFNRTNAAMALAAFTLTGGDLAQGVALLPHFPGVPGRLERVSSEPLVLVDYAHTPDAVERVLESLHDRTHGRIIAVLGCGGDRDPSKRALMGRALIEGSDLAVATSDNPRSEDPELILNEMCGPNFAGVRISDRREAINYAISQAHNQDIVLIAGKGHELGQEVAGIITAFDDRDVAREALEKRRSR